MDKYIGFDIDSKKVSVCVVESGKKDYYATIGPDIGSMKKFLLSQRQKGIRINLAYEVSGYSGYIHDQLCECVERIAVVNPVKATWIYRTNKKNDRIDARKMAILLSIGELPTVHVPNKEIRQWRQTILHRRNIVKSLTRVKNRVRAVMKSAGYFKAANRGKWWNRLNMAWMQSLTEGKQLWQMQLGQLMDEYAFHNKQLERVTHYLDEYLKSKPGCTLLMSIGGIGPRTAEAIMAYTDGVERFGGARQYNSYFGLVPKLDESGSSRRLGHISKHGPSVVRWLLCEAAWKAIRKSPSLNRFYERVRNGDNKRKKIAIVAVCRKLLSIMRAMLRTGELFNENLVLQQCSENEIDKVA
jgi:transposase